MRLALLALVLLAPGVGALTSVALEGGAFAPEHARAQTWETVRWRWDANETHAIAPDDGGEAWCAPSTEGCERVFPEAGEYAYHCPLHPELRGVVLVSGGSVDSAAPLVASWEHQADGLLVRFDARGAAESRTAIESFSWSFGDGTTGSGRLLTHEYAEPGTYDVTLRIVDESGREVAHTRAIRLFGPADPDVAFRAEAVGLAVHIEAPALAGTHAWDFGDGTGLVCGGSCTAEPETLVSTPTSLVHYYKRGGGFDVRHTLTDANGTRTATTHVSANGDERFDVETTGLTVRVDASKLPHYGNATYEWTFGDLARAEGAVAEHTFSVPGSWSVRLVLRDDAGALGLGRDAVVEPATVTVERAPPEALPRATPLPFVVVLAAIGLALVGRKT